MHSKKEKEFKATVEMAKVELGGRIRWKLVGKKKWHNNIEAKCSSVEELIKIWEKANIKCEEKVIKVGKWIYCPRCHGTGRWWNGHPCFRCYGNQSISFVEENK